MVVKPISWWFLVFFTGEYSNIRFNSTFNDNNLLFSRRKKRSKTIIKSMRIKSERFHEISPLVEIYTSVYTGSVSPQDSRVHWRHCCWCLLFLLAQVCDLWLSDFILQTNHLSNCSCLLSQLFNNSATNYLWRQNNKKAPAKIYFAGKRTVYFCKQA